MKKLTVVILFLALMLGTLASCQTPTNTPTPTGTGTGEVPTESGTNAPAEPETLPAATRQLVEKSLPYTTADEREAWLAERELPNENMTPNLTCLPIYQYGDTYSFPHRLGVLMPKTALVNNEDELVSYLHSCMNADTPESQAMALALYYLLKDIDFSQKSLLMVHVNPSSYLRLSFQGLALQEDALIITYTSPQKDNFFVAAEERWGFIVEVNKVDLPANTDELVFCQSISFPEATDPAMIEYLNLHHGFSALQSYRFEALP